MWLNDDIMLGKIISLLVLKIRGVSHHTGPPGA